MKISVPFYSTVICFSGDTVDSSCEMEAPWVFVRDPFCKTETGGHGHTPSSVECELRSCKQSARRLKCELHSCKQSARSVLPSITLHNATTVLIKRRGKARPAVRRGGRAEKGSVLPRKALERRSGRVAYSFFSRALYSATHKKTALAFTCVSLLSRVSPVRTP